MLRSSLCDYSDAYILVKGTMAIAKETDPAPNNTNKTVKIKNCALFNKCISRINNTQVDDAIYIDVVMLVCNIIEYSDNYSKISGILWQFYGDVPAVNNDNEITDFNVDGNASTISFNFKIELTGQTGKDGTKNVEI